MRVQLIFISGVVSLISACSSVPTSVSDINLPRAVDRVPATTYMRAFYVHPTLGKVENDHKSVINAKRICNERYYWEGVKIGDEVITDPNELRNILKNYRKSKLEDLKAQNPSLSKAQISRQVVRHEANDMPAHIQKIKSLQSLSGKCFRNEYQFVFGGFNHYDRTTGELVNSKEIGVIKF